MISLAETNAIYEAWNEYSLLDPVVKFESAGPFKTNRKINRVKVQSDETSDKVVPQSSDVPDINQVTRQVTVDGACDPSASTAFHSDGNEKRSEVPLPAPHDQELLDSGRSHTPQEVRDFLAKPIRLGSFLFTTASAAGTVLATYTLDKVGLFDNNPVWRNKIAGNMCIRGNIHLRMQVNANPFQQGRLIMCFEPMKQCSTVVYSRLAHRRSITQLPHVQYDICMDSEAEIVIPYLTLGTHYNLVSGENPWGVVNVIVYSPINQGTGSSNAEVTVWAHFSELEVCTPSLVYNQGADPPRRSARPRTRVTKKAIGSKESEGTMGPITRMLGSVGTVAQIAGGVPLFSGVAGSVEWAANLAKGVASSFGWSKPLTAAPNMRMNPTANMYQQNSTGVDNAYNLGLLSENKVSPYPALGGTEVDEMSIDFIKQIQSFNADFVWSDTNVVGDTLYTFEAFPLLTNGSAPVAGVTTVDVSPLGGLSDLFEFYRGSLVVTFKFVKTCFHSGRLAVSFNPGFLTRANPAIPTASVDFTLDQSVYLNRDIIDLKDSHEFEFLIPWTSTVPYLPVGQSFGKLKVHVVNPLREPDTCASSINCIVEVRAAPDFEFMRPKPFRYFPIGLTNPNPPSLMAVIPEEVVLTEKKDEDLSDPVFPQMDDVPKIMKSLGTSSWDPLSTRVAELCVGEQVRSLKQLLSRAICMNDDRQPSNVTTPPWPYLIDAEFKAFVTSGRPANAVPNTSPQMIDYYSLFASLYAFSRGGVIWRFVPLAVTASDRRQYKVALQYDTGGLTFTTAGDFRIADSSIFEYEFTDQLAVYVPQYNPTVGRLNVPMTSQLNAALPYVDYSRLIVFSENTTFANFNGSVWRSGADDTHMSYFLGFPRMAYGA